VKRTSWAALSGVLLAERRAAPLPRGRRHPLHKRWAGGLTAHPSSRRPRPPDSCAATPWAAQAPSRVHS